MQAEERAEIAHEARSEAVQDPTLIDEANKAGIEEDLQSIISIPEADVWSRVADKVLQVDRLDEERNSLAESLRASLSPAESFFQTAAEQSEEAAKSRDKRPRPAKAQERLVAYRTSVEGDLAELVGKHPEVLALEDRRTDAVADLKRSLVKVYSFDLRTKINAAVEKREAKAERYKAPLSEADASALHETTRLSTPSLDLLRDLMSRRNRASIGVAGPRGCGKSTLVNWLVEDPQVRVRLRIPLAAPASYLPREFMLYLYQRVCEEVLDRGHVRRGLLSGDLPAATARSRATSLLNMVIVPLLVCAAGAALVAKYATAEALSSGPRLGALAGAIVTLAVVPLALGAYALRYIPAARESSAQSPMSLAVAYEKLPLRPPTFAGLLIAALFSGLILCAAALQLDGLDWLTVRRAAGAALLVGATATATLFRRNSRSTSGIVQSEDSGIYRRGQRWVTVSATTAAQGVTAVGGLALLTLPATIAEIDATLLVGAVLVASGAAAFVVGRTWLEVLEQDRRRLENVFPDWVTRRAYEERDRIRIQRSVQAGWTTSAKAAAAWMPFEVSAGVSESTTEARTPLGVPDIVHGIKLLLEEAGPAVICIDELDKIESPERAREFLNEIKGILVDTPNAYFLLSMSEDAIANFERRGLPFRDVFDSTFDEVVRVPYLSLDQSRELLNGRVTKLAPPFIGLGHCLSGGLPRDLIRMVDRMFAVIATPTAAEAAPCQIDDIARVLVHSEVVAKLDAVTAAIKPIRLEPYATAALRALHRLDSCKPGSPRQKPCILDDDWLTPIRELDFVTNDINDDDLSSLRILLGLTVELVGFLYYCRTLLEIFRVDEQPALARLVVATEASGAGSLDGLARARQNFAVNPYLAWDEVSLFRRARGLARQNFPQSLILKGTTVRVPKQQKASQHTP